MYVDRLRIIIYYDQCTKIKKNYEKSITIILYRTSDSNNSWQRPLFFSILISAQTEASFQGIGLMLFHTTSIFVL